MTHGRSAGLPGGRAKYRSAVITAKLFPNFADSLIRVLLLLLLLYNSGEQERESEVEVNIGIRDQR